MTAIGASPSPEKTAISVAASRTPAPLTAKPGTTPQETPGLISIVQRFPAPGALASGITWDGSHLWIADNSGTIFKLDTAGRTLGAFSAPDVTPEGLTWDGTHFWLFTTNHGLIYEFAIKGQETTTISSFQSPAEVFGGNITQDMAWDGASLWYANQYNVYQLDTSGNIQSQFAFPQNVMGLDWDGSNLWLANSEWPEKASLSVVDTSGSVLGTFVSPVVEIDALAWGDGCLWALGKDSPADKMTVFKLDVSAARDIVTPRSDTTWQAKVLAADRTQSLRTGTGVEVTPIPPYVADDGMTILVMTVGLKSADAGAKLYPRDVLLTDEQGRTYSLMGLRPSGQQFAIGTVGGIITMWRLDPPVVVFNYNVERATPLSSTTVTGEMPVPAPDGEWPQLVLAWLLPTDASKLKLTVPGGPDQGYEVTS